VHLARFYRLNVEPDLFGGFLLMKQWGRLNLSTTVDKPGNVPFGLTERL
jgi:WGR domain